MVRCGAVRVRRTATWPVGGNRASCGEFCREVSPAAAKPNIEQKTDLGLSKFRAKESLSDVILSVSRFIWKFGSQINLKS